MSGAGTPLISVQDGVTVVALAGPEFEILNERTLDQLKDSLLEIAQNAEPPLLVLDLADTQFFGSSFIEILFRVANRLKNRNGKFAICNLTEYCHEVIQITHLDSLWPVVDSREEAVRKVTEKPVTV